MAASVGDAIWRQAPTPAIRVHGLPGTLRVETNDAARCWGFDLGVTDDDWLRLAERACGTDADAALSIGLPPVGVSCRVVVLPDGALVWVEPAQPIGRGRAGAEFDIALLQRSGRIGQFTRDLRTGSGYWNPGMFELMDLDPAQGIPDFDATVDRVVHPDDRDRLRQHFRSLRETAGRGELRFRVRHQDGEIRYLHSLFEVQGDERGRPCRMQGVLVDDTHAAHMLQAERAEGRFLQQALELAGVSVWRIDAERRRIRFNALGSQLAGVAHDPLGVDLERLRETLHPDDRPLVEAAARRAETEGGAVDQVARYRQPDGSWRTLLTRRMALPAAPGQRPELAGISIDLTEATMRHDLEREVRRAEEASRDKSAFLAMMSHRLRTPLNAVIGFAQLAMRDEDEPVSGRQLDRLQRIDAAGHEMLALVDEVFELAHLDADAVATESLPVALADLIPPVLAAVRPRAAQGGVGLHVEAYDADLRIATDRRLLVQCLAHLLSHGVARCARGGRVDIGLATGDTDVTIHLHDSGPGWTPAQRELLLEAPTEGGQDLTATGDPSVPLGLVRRLLERLGAGLELSGDDDGAGSIVVRLPRAAGQVAPAAHMSMLCIEDNPVNQMLVRELVAQRPGIELAAADDGRTGIESALRQPPDVILLDLHLPDMPGEEVLRHLRAEPSLQHCRVIAVTASTLPEGVRQAREIGFDDYWTKPLDYSQFLAGLDRLAAEVRERRRA